MCRNFAAKKRSNWETKKHTIVYNTKFYHLKTLGLTDKNCKSSKLASIKLIRWPESRDMQLTRREGAHERPEFQKVILTHVCLHAASSKSDDPHGPKH